MSEIMRPLSFEALVKWIQTEYRNSGSVFGIRKNKIYRGQGFPLGPAAGPHTQLAQNIVSAWLAGSRFIELKTVQTMDGEDLRKCVPRPCINAADEGYNVEWSTELTVEDAFAEYVKAWFLLHIFMKEFDISGERDFVFNMSVGYSLDGIQSKKIDDYIEDMKDARKTAPWESCRQYLSNNIDLFSKFTKNDLDRISPAISPGITLSTLHGCPREEIEKIGAYLISEKNLHTYIKCNPTLLGYETARNIVDSMGYAYLSFDEHHFKEDLQFADAVEMLKRLKNLAASKKLDMGVKITNTFPVEIKHNELPGQEMYMSGRALFGLSINAAQKLSAAFNGALPVSYSGGADYFNIGAIIETGIRPVTVATTILKPGGYERFNQLAAVAEKRAGETRGLTGIDLEKLTRLAAGITRSRRYRKEYREAAPRKAAPGSLPLFDCFAAPCNGEGGCPIHQQIPAYLEKAAAGDWEAALQIIARDNTAPAITGAICDHQCQKNCTRLDYEDPLEIREAKKNAVENAGDAFIKNIKPAPLKTGKRVAVIGGGPAGIAAAVFLRRNGVPVTVYEKRDDSYGIVRQVIPAFRIAGKTIETDYRLALHTGVDFQFGVDENYSISELQKSHGFVVLATGAWKAGAPPVKAGAENIIDALDFLSRSKKSGLKLALGKKVAVIGGGDVAMDCARAAARNEGVENVTLVYRRTREFMPAQREEQEAAIKDGVVFAELLAPIRFQDGVLVCEKQRLGDYDSSGRRGVTGSGEKTEACFDTVIGATGARVDTALFAKNGIRLSEKGFAVLNENNESSIENVYIAGDCRAGAATVVKAVADGKTAARDILRKLGIAPDFAADARINAAWRNVDTGTLYDRKGVLVPAVKEAADSSRCLGCDAVCEICADVCPNRANIAVTMENGRRQIVHIDRMCNECGNCAVFCPQAGYPYKEKFTVFSGSEDFEDSDNAGILWENGAVTLLRLADKKIAAYKKGDAALDKNFSGLIDVLVHKYEYLGG